MVEDMPPTSR